MTPKEKSFRIFGLMRTEISLLHDSELLKDKIAKNLAHMAVDEIIKTLKDNDLYIGGETNIDEIIRFWQEVKREIEKL